MDFLLITIIALVLWFWWDSSGTRELATQQAKKSCKEAGVVFLDDTVALSRLRLRRVHSGSMVFARRFVFEFCTDGQRRYAGYVDMLGKRVQQIHMDAYRLIDEL